MTEIFQQARLILTVDNPVRYLRDMYVDSEDLPPHFIEDTQGDDRLVRAPRPTRDRR